MGNGQSQHTSKKEAQLWALWSPEEQEKLRAFFEHGSSSSLPTYFDNSLCKAIQAALFQPEKQVDHYLAAVQAAIKNRDAGFTYTAFHAYVDAEKGSLQDFVSAIVRSAVPIWFESGSSYEWTYQDADASPLIHYFINQAEEKKRLERESMAWLNEDASASHSNTNKGDSWQQKAAATDKSSDTIDESEFMQWIDNTPALQTLFGLAVRFVLLGKPTAQDLHTARLHHLASPQLQQHNKDTTRLLGANKFSSLMTPYDYFLLTTALPGNALSWSDYERTQRKANSDVEHQLVYCSRRDGASWQVFVSKLVGQGATLVVLRGKDGGVFGGYADDAWEYCNTNWYGNSANYLFRLRDTCGLWRGSAGSNNHYQYLCWGKKSLPNGFGMGGQFEYAGLWIDSDFIHGHSRAGPLCTTYASPQLSKEDTFVVDEAEVWLVRPLQRDEDDEQQGGGGVLSHAEDMEFMEMAGKKMYSKDLGPEPSDDSDDDNNDAAANKP